jgi:hypothetical protein
MQVEKSLVTEVRLGASMAYEQYLRHRVKAEEEVVCLLIALLVTFQQIHLKFDVIHCLLVAAASPLFSFRHHLSFLNVLHIESDTLAQLKKWFSHAYGHAVDNVAANDRVHYRGTD